MAAGSVTQLTLSVVLTAAATQYRGIQVTGAAVAAAGNGLIAMTSGAIGERIPVAVEGTTLAEAGAAIAAGALCEFDASGRIVTRSAGAIVGRLAPGQSAAAAGDVVEMIIIKN